MSTRTTALPESAVAAAENAELGDFDRSFPGSQRNAWLCIFLAVVDSPYSDDAIFTCASK